MSFWSWFVPILLWSKLCFKYYITGKNLKKRNVKGQSSMYICRSVLKKSKKPCLRLKLMHNWTILIWEIWKQKTYRVSECTNSIQYTLNKYIKRNRGRRLPNLDKVSTFDGSNCRMCPAWRTKTLTSDLCNCS